MEMFWKRLESMCWAPMVMVLPDCTMGGLAAICLTRDSASAPENQPRRAWTWPTMWTRLSVPGVMWTYPAPVETDTVGAPPTERVLSKVASESAAKAAGADAARMRAATKIGLRVKNASCHAMA